MEGSSAAVRHLTHACAQLDNLQTVSVTSTVALPTATVPEKSIALMLPAGLAIFHMKQQSAVTTLLQAANVLVLGDGRSLLNATQLPTVRCAMKAMGEKKRTVVLSDVWLSTTALEVVFGGKQFRTLTSWSVRHDSQAMSGNRLSKDVPSPDDAGTIGLITTSNSAVHNPSKLVVELSERGDECIDNESALMELVRSMCVLSTRSCVMPCRGESHALAFQAVIDRESNGKERAMGSSFVKKYSRHFYREFQGNACDRVGKQRLETPNLVQASPVSEMEPLLPRQSKFLSRNITHALASQVDCRIQQHFDNSHVLDEIIREILKHQLQSRKLLNTSNLFCVHVVILVDNVPSVFGQIRLACKEHVSNSNSNNNNNLQVTVWNLEESLSSVVNKMIVASKGTLTVVVSTTKRLELYLQTSPAFQQSICPSFTLLVSHAGSKTVDPILEHQIDIVSSLLPSNRHSILLTNNLTSSARYETLLKSTFVSGIVSNCGLSQSRTQVALSEEPKISLPFVRKIPLSEDLQVALIEGRDVLCQVSAGTSFNVLTNLLAVNIDSWLSSNDRKTPRCILVLLSKPAEVFGTLESFCCEHRTQGGIRLVLVDSLLNSKACKKSNPTLLQSVVIAVGTPATVAINARSLLASMPSLLSPESLILCDAATYLREPATAMKTVFSHLNHTKQTVLLSEVPIDEATAKLFLKRHFITSIDGNSSDCSTTVHESQMQAFEKSDITTASTCRIQDNDSLSLQSFVPMSNTGSMDKSETAAIATTSTLDVGKDISSLMKTKLPATITKVASPPASSSVAVDSHWRVSEQSNTAQPPSTSMQKHNSSSPVVLEDKPTKELALSAHSGVTTDAVCRPSNKSVVATASAVSVLESESSSLKPNSPILIKAVAPAPISSLVYKGVPSFDMSVPVSKARSAGNAAVSVPFEIETLRNTFLSKPICALHVKSPKEPLTLLESTLDVVLDEMNHSSIYADSGMRILLLTTNTAMAMKLIFDASCKPGHMANTVAVSAATTDESHWRLIQKRRRGRWVILVGTPNEVRSAMERSQSITDVMDVAHALIMEDAQALFIGPHTPATTLCLQSVTKKFPLILLSTVPLHECHVASELLQHFRFEQENAPATAVQTLVNPPILKKVSLIDKGPVRIERTTTSTIRAPVKLHSIDPALMSAALFHGHDCLVLDRDIEADVLQAIVHTLIFRRLPKLSTVSLQTSSLKVPMRWTIVILSLEADYVFDQVQQMCSTMTNISVETIDMWTNSKRKMTVGTSVVLVTTPSAFDDVQDIHLLKTVCAFVLLGYESMRYSFPENWLTSEARDKLPNCRQWVITIAQERNFSRSFVSVIRSSVVIIRPSLKPRNSDATCNHPLFRLDDTVRPPSLNVVSMNETASPTATSDVSVELTSSLTLIRCGLNCALVDEHNSDEVFDDIITAAVERAVGQHNLLKEQRTGSFIEIIVLTTNPASTLTAVQNVCNGFRALAKLQVINLETADNARLATLAAQSQKKMIIGVVTPSKMVYHMSKSTRFGLCTSQLQCVVIRETKEFSGGIMTSAMKTCLRHRNGNFQLIIVSSSFPRKTDVDSFLQDDRCMVGSWISDVISSRVEESPQEETSSVIISESCFVMATPEQTRQAIVAGKTLVLSIRDDSASCMSDLMTLVMKEAPSSLQNNCLTVPLLSVRVLVLAPAPMIQVCVQLLKPVFPVINLESHPWKDSNPLSFSNTAVAAIAVCGIEGLTSYVISDIMLYATRLQTVVMLDMDMFLEDMYGIDRQVELLAKALEFAHQFPQMIMLSQSPGHDIAVLKALKATGTMTTDTLASILDVKSDTPEEKQSERETNEELVERLSLELANRSSDFLIRGNVRWGMKLMIWSIFSTLLKPIRRDKPTTELLFPVLVLTQNVNFLIPSILVGSRLISHTYDQKLVIYDLLEDSAALHSQAVKQARGYGIVVTTPGRLLYHMKSSSSFMSRLRGLSTVIISNGNVPLHDSQLQELVIAMNQLDIPNRQTVLLAPRGGIPSNMRRYIFQQPYSTVYV